MKITRDDIERVLSKHRNLTAYGCSPCSGTILAGADDAELWLTLLDDVVGVQQAHDWLVATPEARGSSYWLKHVAERELGLDHMFNGSLIVAAVLAGRRIKWRDADGCWVNPEILAVPGFGRRRYRPSAA